ncbi:hypothetical protein ACFYZ9_34925 [Streptomyces sp. NPDC001691]|uniref:hypothetical protein n=1 Tax=Streptomyces sp. NPDC001691 TaxID=3364600 RepID=UPI00369557C1
MTPSKASDIAAVLTHQIWLDLWSTAPVPGLSRVTSAQQLQVDDLIVTLSAQEDAAQLTGLSARDAVREAGTRVWRVISTGAKTVRVRPVAVPNGTWDGTPDLARLGEPWVNDAPSRQVYISATKRQIGRLGSLDALQKQIAAHIRFGEWQRAYEAAEAEESKDRAAAKAAYAQILARRESRRELGERVNEIAGDQLVYWADFGGSDGAGSLSGWLASKGRLRTYLLGLQAASLITKEQYEEAERCMALLEQ